DSPTYFASSAPAMPTTVVMMNPIGSRPGSRNRATIPMTRPLTMVMTRCIATLPLRPRARGRRAGSRASAPPPRPRAGPGGAALVDRDIDQHRAALHVLDHVGGDELGGRGAGHQHRADHQVGAQHLALDGVARGKSRVQARAELQIQVVEPLQALVDDDDVR